VSGGGAASNTKPVPAGRRVPRESPGALDVGTEISSQGGVDPVAVDNPELNAVHAHWRRLGVTAHLELALVQSPVVGGVSRVDAKSRYARMRALVPVISPGYSPGFAPSHAGVVPSDPSEVLRSRP